MSEEFKLPQEQDAELSENLTGIEDVPEKTEDSVNDSNNISDGNENSDLPESVPANESLEGVSSDEESLDREVSKEEQEEGEANEGEQVEGEVNTEGATEDEQPTKPEAVDAVFQELPSTKNPLYPRRKPYHERYYLKFGFDEIPEGVDPDGTEGFLQALGYGSNFLKEAREGRTKALEMEQTYQADKKRAHYCDFCGVELIGTEYSILKDGRERCPNCSRSVVKTEDEFIMLFEDILDNLRIFFGVRIAEGIQVRMVNTKTLQKKVGSSFVPSAEFTPRTLGVAIKEKDGMYIYVENGTPRLAAIATLVHELTHIWQYVNWNQKEIMLKYGPRQNLQIYEGMAKWVEIQYMYLLGESVMAKRMELETLLRNDEYGNGFKKYISVYPLSYGTSLEDASPFDDVHRPL